MKKKIGSSKSMKKYVAGGQSGPGDGRDSIPSGSAIYGTAKAAKGAIDEYMKKKNSKPGPKYNTSNPTSISKPIYEIGKQEPSKSVKYDKYKKGGSVGKMKMGGAVKKSSKRK